MFTPLTVLGVHSPSWNKRALGIEMLGEYQTEPFNSGRGAQVPAFAKLAARFLQQLGLLDGTARKKGVVSEGATLAKSAVGTAIIVRLVKAANALYLLYKAEEPTNLAEAASMHRHASDYTNMSDQALATEATDLTRRVTANKTLLLSDYNLTAASIKGLTDDARSFDTQLTAPQLAIDANKIKGATAKSTLNWDGRVKQERIRC